MKDNVSIRQFISSRMLPKTGQIISYQTGDDGYNEFGWWQGRYNSDNKVRYIAQTISGDDIVIDRATGLMWAADGNKAGCFNGGSKNFSDANIYCESLNFAGFSDWHYPNVKELMSILEYDAGLSGFAMIKEPPFSNTAIDSYGTSTTLPDLTTKNLIVTFVNGQISGTLKTNAYKLRAVRIL